jgi:peroxiredoxin
MAIAAGSKAPDFTLKSKNASGLADVALSKNLGKKNIVLLFFPLAFTGVCTTEMCDVTAGLSQFGALNAEVIGVSVDSPFAGSMGGRSASHWRATSTKKRRKLTAHFCRT